MVSNDAPRSEIQSVLKTVLNYWKVYSCMNILKDGFNFKILQIWIITPAFLILVHKNCLCRQNTHQILYISNKFLGIPPVEIFFDMEFSGKTTAIYMMQGYSNSETHPTHYLLDLQLYLGIHSR